MFTKPAYENPTEEQKREAERWEPFYSKIDEVVVPNNARLLKAFRDKGMEVCFAKIQCQKRCGSDRSLDQKATGYNELLLPPGDPSAEIVPELAPLEDEIVVTKTTDSALTGTALRLWLHNMGIDTVVCTGVLTDQCVSGAVIGGWLAEAPYWFSVTGTGAAFIFITAFNYFIPIPTVVQRR